MARGLVDDPVAYVRHRVPKEFWRRTLLALRDAKHDAVSMCNQLRLSPERRHGLTARVRRACFEDAWIKLASDHGGIGRSPRDESSYHAEVSFDFDLILTHYPLFSPGDVPPPANYRLTLARGPQGLLWSQYGESPESEGALYGILTYSAYFAPATGLPIFASVKFPDRAMKFHGVNFDLKPILEELTAELMPKSAGVLLQEEVVSDPSLSLQPLTESVIEHEPAAVEPVKQPASLREQLTLALEEPQVNAYYEEEQVPAPEPDSTIKPSEKKQDEGT